MEHFGALLLPLGMGPGLNRTYYANDDPKQPSDKDANDLSSDGRHRVFGPGRVKKNR